MNRKEIASSFFWKLCERGASQIITIVVQIILARLLVPEAFGTLAIMVVFTNLANVLIQKGFAFALIRKDSATADDFDTAFLLSEGIALLCVALLFFLSPLIASYYGDPGLTAYIRVLSLSLIFGSLCSIQNAELVRNMQFKVIFIRGVIAAVVSGVLGILCAYKNMGVWALVVQVVSQQFILCVVTFFGCRWRPRFRYSKASFRSMFSFGSKILIAELISTAVEDLRTLIIGKKYDQADLAYYDRGQSYPAAFMRAIYETISNVMLPVLSREKNEKDHFDSTLVTSVLLSTYLIFPIFVGLAAVSDLFVLLLLTEKWAACIPFLRLFCIYQLAFPVYGIMKQGLFAVGDGKGVLGLEIARAVLFLSAIVIGCLISPFAVALFTGIALYLTTAAFAVYVHRFHRYDARNMLAGMLVSALQCVVMYAVIRLFNMLSLPGAVLLIADIVLGILIYLATSVLFRNKAYYFLKDLIASRLKEQKR